MKFENQVVIVTGASSGIGEGVARMFLEEGARLVGCGIEPAMKIESENAIYVQADLTDPDQAQNVVDKAVEAFGQVDKLVCCAGVTFIGSLENTEYNTFMRELSINLGGVFNMCKAAVKELVKSQDPSLQGRRHHADQVHRFGVRPQGAGQLCAARPGAHPHD